MQSQRNRSIAVDTLQTLVSMIETDANITTPCDPFELACALGLFVWAESGRDHELRKVQTAFYDQLAGGQCWSIYIDANASDDEQARFIALACATYYLRESGLELRTDVTATDLAAALCGQ
ncbi:MAG TPA: hypothetical protein VGI70_18260 [Polyangiales bacterium]